VSPSKTRPSIATLKPANPASLLAAAADLALLVDEKGVIRDVAVANAELSSLGSDAWVGRRWTETVTVESREKVEDLLDRAKQSATRVWRHVNHASRDGVDVPMLYATVPAGPPGQVLAIGRDLRQLAEVQQRLIAAQQSLERDYLRLRQLEARHRLLFQRTTDALLVVDTSTAKVVEANPAAAELLGDSVRRLVGRPVAECFESASRTAVRSLLENARTARRDEAASVRLVEGGATATATATAFRQDNDSLVLLRVSAGTPRTEPGSTVARGLALDAVAEAPDAIVITDASGRIQHANASFAELAQVDGPAQVLGEPIERWLGRSGLDVAVLLSSVRQGESVRLFPTVVRSRDGGETQVEISACSGTNDAGGARWLAFFIRDVERRLPAAADRTGNGLGRPTEQLTELVGRVPLKDIVSETTDLIEQACIEAALKLTRDNRAAAAEMLGLSRQSLYVKLRRYGLGDMTPESDG
jgi:transcriptional regulator PpsR